MAVKNTAKVIIGGKIITLGGYESEEYFQKVASYINKKMDELVLCRVTADSPWRPSIHLSA